MISATAIHDEIANFLAPKYNKMKILLEYRDYNLVSWAHLAKELEIVRKYSNLDLDKKIKLLIVTNR